MRAFTIEFNNFAVVVHHRTATTVVFGSDGHDLRFRSGTSKDVGQWTPVDKDITVMLRVVDDAKETEVQNGPVRAHTGSYMLDLNQVFKDLRIDEQRITGNNRDDQNARVRLHGGDLFDHPAINESNTEHKLANALWSFEEFGAPAPALHRVTNRVSFVQRLEDGFSYALIIGKTTVELKDMTVVTFENRDSDTSEYECDEAIMQQKPGAKDEEFSRLLPAIGIDPRGGVPRLAVVAPFPLPPDKICQPCGIPCARVDFE